MQKNEAIEKVAEWIEKGCDYTIGCSLFAIYGKNKTLSRIFPCRQQRYEGKLKYELCKAVGLTNAFLKMKAEETQETVSTNPPADGDKVKSGNEEELPEEVKMIIAELSKLTADRVKLHGRMSSIEGNDESSVKDRKELSNQIESMSNLIEVLYAVKEAYYNDKVLPNLAELFPVKEEISETGKNEKESELKLPATAEALNKMKKNLQNSISKHKNMLEFQTDTKQEIQNPMPDGSKRVKIETQIANKLKIIEAIELKLVEIAG